jgi:O-antigen ligase
VRIQQSGNAFGGAASSLRFAAPIGLAIGTVVVAALASALIAFVVAQGRLQWQMLAAGAIGLGVAVAAVRERRLLLLVVMVLGVQVVFHKSLGPLNLEIASGAPGLFLTSVDVLLITLYVAWLLEGTLFVDIQAGLRRPMIFIPVVAPLAALPSFIMAESLDLAVAELFRMTCMLALFLYLALRLQSRREIVVLVGAIFVIAFVQVAVTAAQWKSGSTLGLVAIGQGSELVARVADSSETPRPSGTIVHPVFFGALMAEILLLALSVALGSRHTIRFLGLGAAGAALIAALFAQSRAALLAIAVVGALLFLWYVWRGRVSGRTLLLTVLAAVVCTVIFRGYLMDRIVSNVGTDHFDLEVESRLELNQMALVVIRDAPVIGVGLNNFETVLRRYDEYGLIFADNPVHNLYLLVLAETGVIGLLAMMASFLALVAGAFRLARAVDPLLASLGVGALAVYGFFLIEEMTVFSLREEVPLLVFWMISGLVAAGLRIAEQDVREPARIGMAA